jgi:hypothetical protein
MRQVQVNLRSGYIARYVRLRVGKTITGRRWEIQAADDNGTFTTNITVDGQSIPEFTTQRDALALLATLPQDRIWATSDRVPSSVVQAANNPQGWSLVSA